MNVRAYISAAWATQAESMIWGPNGVIGAESAADLDTIENVAGPWFQTTCNVTVLD